MVILVGRQFEAHIRYTKVTKQEGAKPGDEPPGPVVKPSPAPTTAPAVPAATSQPAQDPEKQARDKLRVIQLYIDSGMKDQAKQMLQSVIKEYPNTEAAKTAKTKLTDLGG